MLTNKAETYTTTSVRSYSVPADRSLQVVLWVVWTAAVVATVAWNWYLDISAGHPINFIGMTVHSVLAGLIGLIVMTLVERWMEPQRFID